MKKIATLTVFLCFVLQSFAQEAASNPVLNEMKTKFNGTGHLQLNGYYSEHYLIDASDLKNTYTPVDSSSSVFFYERGIISTYHKEKGIIFANSTGASVLYTDKIIHDQDKQHQAQLRYHEGTYSIHGDTIEAEILLDYFKFFPRYNSEITHFRGILKDPYTIEDWKIVPPYPMGEKNQMLLKPRTLKAGAESSKKDFDMLIKSSFTVFADTVTPLFFFANGVIIQSDLTASLTDFAHIIQDSAKQQQWLNTQGRYYIHNDTIEACVPLTYQSRFPRYKTRLTHFRGILKDTNTITDWKIVPPYPHVGDPNDFRPVPQTLRFASFKFKNYIDSSGPFIRGPYYK
jgi:hypothetical protein